MDIKDIIKQFRNIERPSSNDDVLPVVSIGGMLHKLSVSPEGFPRFLWQLTLLLLLLKIS